MIVHAGCAAIRLRQGWAGVLITGPSGSGKSDLTLRLLARGWRLVADDRAQLWTSGGKLYAKAPEALAGLVEARGLDVVTLPRLEVAAVALVAECVPAAEALERLPEQGTVAIRGVEVARVRMRALEPSAPLKLELALAHQGADV